MAYTKDSRVRDEETTHGIQIQFDVICDECGDVDNWIAVHIGEYRKQLKCCKEQRKKAGWRIGNDNGRKTLCPTCNNNAANMLRK